MFDMRTFFTFTPDQTMVDYMRYYINQPESPYYCFSNEAGGAMPEEVLVAMNRDPSPATVSRICSILDATIEVGGEQRAQFINFETYFLPYFDGLMVGEFFDDYEEASVFLARGDDTITYDQLYVAHSVAASHGCPSVKFAAEMAIDIWQELYGVIDDGAVHFVGGDICDFISHSEYTDMYRSIIFDAAAASDNYIIPALVNIFTHAHAIVMARYAPIESEDEDEDEDVIMEQL